MNLDKVKELLAFMESHDLCEIEVEEEGMRIRLKKSGSGSPEVIAPTVVHMPAMVPGVTAAQQPPEEEDPDEDTMEITSPMVGTFYRSPTPDADAFVSVGEEIEEDTVVCIIEAMKVMNEIRSEKAGEMVAILVENGEAIEFGQPLMIVKPKPSPA